MSQPTCSLPATDHTRQCRTPAVYRMRLDRTVLVAYACANHRDVLLESCQRAAIIAQDRLIVERLAWQVVPAPSLSWLPA